jgi:ElaB/YqjD/DUF883 family membrane-anchored ribosome-binding protein
MHMATSNENPFPSSESMTGRDDDLSPGGSGLGRSGMSGSSSMGSGMSSSTGLSGSGVSGLDEGGMPRSASMGGSGDDMLTRVVQGAHQTIDRLAETAAPHVQRLQQGLDSKSGQVREMSDEWTESLRSTVRDNPIAAVATAVAVGLLLARLTR